MKSVQGCRGTGARQRTVPYRESGFAEYESGCDWGRALLRCGDLGERNGGVRGLGNLGCRDEMRGWSLALNDGMGWK
jgi:hypothetical protein